MVQLRLIRHVQLMKMSVTIKQRLIGYYWTTRFVSQLFFVLHINPLISLNQTDRSDKLTVTQTGSGGLEEMR